MNNKRNDTEDPRLAQMLDVIFKFATGDLTARGTLADDGSALDGVMAGINILGEELQAKVAETQLAQQTLSESEAQLSGIFNATPDGVLMAEAETRQFQMANTAICRMLGYKLDELLKLRVDDIHPEENFANLARQFERQLKGEINLVTLPMKRKDGSVFYADVNTAPVMIGGQRYLTGVFRDITERKQAELAIKESEAKYRQLFEDSRDALMVIKPPSWRFIDSNRAMLQMFGASSVAKFNALGPWDLSPERQSDGSSSAEMAQEMIATALREGSCSFEWEHKRLNGESFAADVQLTRVEVDGQFFIKGTVRDISERKQAEDEIQKLNAVLEAKVRQLQATQGELEQHRAHLEQKVAQRTASLTETQRIAHLGNWEWDIVNNTVRWSDELYSIFGLPRQFQASFENFLNIVHPQDRQLVKDSMNNALKRQHTYNIEHRLLLSDGSLRYVHGQAEVIRGVDEQPISMLGTLQDITRHKQTEAEIRKQQAITSQIIETIPMRVFWKDATLHYLGCNTAFARDAGKNSSDELLGKDDYQMAWKDQAELYRADDQKVIDTDMSKLSYDEPQTTPSGKHIWLRTSKVPLHNDAKEVIGMLGVYEDITERKQLELSYLESEKRFRNLTELTTDWVWQTDKHGSYIYAGTKIQNLLGYEPEEVIGKTPLDFMPPEEAARVAKIFQDVTSSKKPFSYLENTTLHKDGHKVILESSGVPLIDDAGNLYGYFGTERNITERKRAEEETYLLATTDSLTGIANRRQFSSLLEREVEQAKRYGTLFSIAMYDLDFFKRVNDNFGHDEGDKVLRTITELVKENIRAMDVVARWGGEEFMLLMPQTEIDSARNAAEKLRLTIAEYDFDKVGRLTASFGVATFEPQDDSDSLLKRVDDALYRAKENGRNRVETLTRKAVSE